MKSPLKGEYTFRCSSFINAKMAPASVVHSFLCYDAQLEIGLAKAGHYVMAHTNAYPLHEFWVCAMCEPLRVAKIALWFHPLGDSDTVELFQKTWRQYDSHHTRAGIFFLLNQCSHNGLVSCGLVEDSNFTAKAVRRLAQWAPHNFHTTYDEVEDYLDGIASATEADYLLFPVGKYSFNFFEEGKSRGDEMTLVNHKKLKERLQGLDQKWLVVYKYHPRLLKEYKDYETTMISKYGQPTKHPNMCEDIVIANF